MGRNGPIDAPIVSERRHRRNCSDFASNSAHVPQKWPIDVIHCWLNGRGDLYNRATIARRLPLLHVALTPNPKKNPERS
jgi:hypothetical protein